MVDLENWNFHKNGSKVCILSNAFPIFDEAGNLKGYRGVDKDIIAQTAYALLGYPEKAIEAGCNDYISKPIKKSEFIDLMQRYLK